MSTMVDQKPLTVAQRTARAADEAASLLGVPDAKVLGAVLAEAALDELRLRGGFMERVRAAYEAATVKPAKPKRATQPKSPAAKTKVKLVPIGRVETHEINIAAPMDPYYLNQVFGPDQLPFALEEFSTSKLLDEAVPLVQKRHPGTRPKTNGKKAVIDYLVRFVVSD